jgi:enoyl-CoA hydratase/carnithine racemase
VLSTALTLADGIAQHPPVAVSGTRRVLEHLLAPLSPDIAAEIEALQRDAYLSADAQEARAAFREKRAPRFTGK